MNEWVLVRLVSLKPNINLYIFLVLAILGWGQPRLMRCIFGMNLAQGTGLIASPVDLQSGALPKL